MGRLAQIFERQAEYLRTLAPIYRRNEFHLHAAPWPLDFQGRHEQEEFRLLAWRFTEEMIEAMETFENGAPRLDYHEEMSDALHFLIELCLATGVSYSNLVDGMQNIEPSWNVELEDSLDYVFRRVGKDPIQSNRWFSSIRSLGMATMNLRQRPWRTDDRESNYSRFLLMMQATFWTFVNTCIRTGMSAEDLHRAYFAKAKINDGRTAQTAPMSHFDWALPLYRIVAKKPAAGYQAIGKVVQDVASTQDRLPGWTLEDWGYGRNKVAQLKRNYINEEEFARVRAVLDKRGLSKYTSVAVSLRGKPKDSRSQGWCMLSLIVSRSKDFTSVEVQYRTTEILLKFAADVWFLGEMCKMLEIEPDYYTFRFANCALSGAYFPYLIDKVDLSKFLIYLQREDPEFLIRTTRFLLKACYKKDQFHPFSPERMSHKFLWERASSQQIADIRRYLEPLHRATGRPLPKDFHDKSYVPKGQRGKSDEEE